jgi:hypothetical protein
LNPLPSRPREIVMKQTLYQILGVDPGASFEDIEIAYAKRFEELSVATIQDPNRLVVLNQARDILSDPNRRMAYDASLSKPAAPTEQADEPESPGWIQAWGRWIAAAVAVLGIALIWSIQDSPPQTPPAATAPAETASSPSAATEADDGTVESLPADEPVAVADTAATPDEPQNPIVGRWSCFDPVLGRSSRYVFLDDGRVEINASDEPLRSGEYNIAGNTLTLTTDGATSTLAIEQMDARKLVLNSGGEGKRLVCSR